LSEIGEIAAFARRSGDRWFLAVLNGPTARTVRIPLSFLGTSRYCPLLVRDKLVEPVAVEIVTCDVACTHLPALLLRVASRLPAAGGAGDRPRRQRVGGAPDGRDDRRGRRGRGRATLRRDGRRAGPSGLPGDRGEGRPRGDSGQQCRGCARGHRREHERG